MYESDAAGGNRRRYKRKNFKVFNDICIFYVVASQVGKSISGTTSIKTGVNMKKYKKSVKKNQK